MTKLSSLNNRRLHEIKVASFLRAGYCHITATGKSRARMESFESSFSTDYTADKILKLKKQGLMVLKRS